MSKYTFFIIWNKSSNLQLSEKNEEIKYGDTIKWKYITIQIGNNCNDDVTKRGFKMILIDTLIKN